MRKVPVALLAALAALLAITLLGVSACGPNQAGTSGPTTMSTESATAVAETTVTTGPIGAQAFTLEQLAKFDGKDGRAAYVAVDGVVYDVSASAKWPQGVHTGCNLGAMAGKDLSLEISKAPGSMRSLLSRMPVVGTLE